MDINNIENSKSSAVNGVLAHGVSLAEYTSWRVGGPARSFYKPIDVADLANHLSRISPEEPILWLGLGSNTLIRDKGFAGTVILTQGNFGKIALLDENLVRVESGVACATMARFCARNNLRGCEFWAGIPGTMGGALRMNAGCFDGETWNYLESVETVDRSGQLHCRLPTEFEVSYRHVAMPGEEWFVSATFRLAKGEKEESLEKIRQLLHRRAETQPTGDHTCGSVFRNPPHDHAGRLIESCDLKGFSIGGAHVSMKHANFIVNNGTASAADIESLIEYVENKVADKHGVKLIREVHIVGER